MTAELIAAARAVMEAVDFPFDGLRPVWVSRAPKIVLAFARVPPEGTLADAKGWGDPSNGLLGSRALITVLNRDWNEKISSGSYDDVRRKCVKFLVEAGIVLKDPDNPNKAPNDSTTGYALSPTFANLLKAFGTEAWDAQLQNFTSANGSLREKLRQEREMRMVPVKLPDGTLHLLSPGEHNRLQASIIEHFLPRYAKGGEVVYIADALERQLHKDEALMEELGLFKLDHRQLPDVIVFDRPNGWVLIIEAVESSGQLSPLRMLELKRLLEPCRFPQVFVSAFPDYAVFSRFANDIAWETEVWIADHPTHLIHYDGKRYLGPYI